MGMYDYLGEYQVKVFSVPLTPINKLPGEMDNVLFSPSTSGGSLVYFAEGAKVPYKSHIYNYGPNFIVFDFRYFLTDNENEIVHIIRDGKYYKSMNYKELPDNTDMSLVVDNYGSPLNIKNISDFAKISEEHKIYSEEYNKLKKEYEMAAGVTQPLNMETIKNMTKEEANRQIKAMGAATDKAFKETLNIFNEKWFVPSSDDVYDSLFDKTGLGFVIVECTRKTDAELEWDKYMTVKAYLQYLEKESKTLSEIIDKYIQWNNEFSYDSIMAIFNKYNSEVPKNVIDDYKKSLTYKIRMSHQ